MLRFLPAPGPNSGRVRLTHSVLFNTTMAHPNNTPAVLADRLAARHGWTAEERQYHYERLYDLRRTTALLAVFQHSSLPTAHTTAQLETLAATIDERFLDGQRTLDDLDEH